MTDMLNTEAHPDWKVEARLWIKETLAQLHYTDVGDEVSVSSWYLGDVWRIPTGSGDVYFKATAALPLFSNEAELCQCLNDLFKGYVANVLAVDTKRRWQLTSDFGRTLNRGVDLEVFEEAYKVWGELQVSSVEHVSRLRQVGCQERTIDNLTEQLKWHLCHPKIEVILNEREFYFSDSLYPALDAAINELKGFPLPECLVHGDLHQGNIARAPGSFLFFDWSDACISHPFMDGVRLYALSDSRAKENLISSYLAKWGRYLPENKLRQAWKLAEPLCHAHQAITYASFILNAPDDQDSADDARSFIGDLTRYLTLVIEAFIPDNSRTVMKNIFEMSDAEILEIADPILKDSNIGSANKDWGQFSRHMPADSRCDVESKEDVEKQWEDNEYLTRLSIDPEYIGVIRKQNFVVVLWKQSSPISQQQYLQKLYLMQRNGVIIQRGIFIE